MNDVAALAGVALKTVSRVINGVATVDPELARRVKDAADKLGYRPNLAASNLRRGHTSTVGLLLADVSNPFSAELHRAIEDYASERGVLVLAASLDEDPERERELAQRLIDQRVDGLIIAPASADHRFVIAEQQLGTSFVFVDRVPTPLVADAVLSDHRAGAAVGVEHLVANGCRSISFLSDDIEVSTARDRFDGYCDALASAGIPVSMRIVRHGLGSAQEAAAETAQLLLADDPPHAIFASRNVVTVGAVQALHELGLQQSVALVGFDDVPFGSALDPGITVVAQNVRELGRKAAERLFARIDGDLSPVSVTIVPTQLMVRGSGEVRTQRSSPARFSADI